MTFTITGTGSALPKKALHNDDLPAQLDTSDAWIAERTGIRQRHICVEESLLDLAVEAGRAALEQADVAPSELDFILCATIRGDCITPSLACMVQKKLGASCPALDVNAACSGFVYALDVAAGYFARGRVRRGLVIAGEAMSKLVDWNDRSTCVLFGDGAGAVVLEEGDDLLSIRLTARGDDRVLVIPHVEGNSPYNPKEDPPHTLSMNGQEVYKFAVTAMSRDVKKVVAEAGITPDQVTWVVPHQANLRIIDAARSRLGIPPERYIVGIHNIANISAASIPIMLDQANRQGKFSPGDYLVLSAFGGGLTTGACVLRWSAPQQPSQ